MATKTKLINTQGIWKIQVIVMVNIYMYKKFVGQRQIAQEKWANVKNI